MRRVTLEGQQSVVVDTIQLINTIDASIDNLVHSLIINRTRPANSWDIILAEA